MQLLCEKLTKFSIPAIRIAVSDMLYSNYDISQKVIALKLGVAQPAVYKYLKGKYSERVSVVTNFIKSSGMHEPIAKAIISGSNPLKVQGMIERLASSRRVSAYCNSLLKSGK
ncbi:hypothetical protein M1567_00075 [Candidatus Marsarchaeota archaeon]|jgi:predicted transcriptional regulator|nr:hypothetical protein [Candidatus Marsarchaeota archaeon]